MQMAANVLFPDDGAGGGNEYGFMSVGQGTAGVAGGSLRPGSGGAPVGGAALGFGAGTAGFGGGLDGSIGSGGLHYRGGAGGFASDFGAGNGGAVGNMASGSGGGGGVPGAPYGEEDFSNEPPLLEELGIDFGHIRTKVTSVLLLNRSIGTCQ